MEALIDSIPVFRRSADRWTVAPSWLWGPSLRCMRLPGLRLHGISVFCLGLLEAACGLKLLGSQPMDPAEAAVNALSPKLQAVYSLALGLRVGPLGITQSSICPEGREAPEAIEGSSKSEEHPPKKPSRASWTNVRWWFPTRQGRLM